ncbi:helix-turn-helix domain-containing protein [Conexibacter woesei]|uniref:helix-turn-helix domain-containing protein n=1 Tax=Conexibacter woesei TaxID=191495 RepID=UPI0018C95E02|nr:PucR family transcriptional regulator ligand-binding domain-containing protein [Conexibacter woesei]
MEDPPTVTLAALLADARLGLELVVPSDAAESRDAAAPPAADPARAAVSWVHATELEDPAPWLSGGELLLTTGAWGLDRADAFAAAVADAGVAAVGWGFLGDERAVPEAVVAACAAHDLPLLFVPRETPFIAIERAFADLQHDRRAAALRTSIDRNERLVAALSAGRRAKARLLTELGRELDREVRIAAPGGAARVAVATAEEPRPARSWALAEGFVLEVAVAGEAEVAVVEQVVPFLRFAIERERDAVRAERRLAAELVDVALAGQTAFASARIKAYGLDPRAPLVGVVVEGATVERVERVLRPHDGVVAPHDGVVVGIVQAREVDGAALHAALGAAVGIGAVAEDAEQLRASLIGAREAAQLAARLTRGWARADEIGSHTLLLALQDATVLETFADNVLGPIVAHDEQHGTELLATLEAFLASGGQWQATADARSMHVNTLRARIARCEQLSGRPIKDMANRVDLFIALRARRAQAAAAASRS